ncbi:hypothetical protein OROHE_016943 [Orobanche hederae]
MAAIDYYEINLKNRSGLFQPPLGEKILRKAILGCFLVAAEVVVAVMSGGNYCRVLSGIRHLWSAVIIASSVFQAVAQFVDGLFKSITYPPSFRDCIRDFLVKSKEFLAQISNEVGRRVWNKL